VTMQGFAEALAGNLKRRREAIQATRCEPRPGRRAYIRAVKAGGRVQRRPWGSPDIGDRRGQEALRMSLDPIWAADFRRHSEGVAS
jgi:retron-type reverse transcriptase